MRGNTVSNKGNPSGRKRGEKGEKRSKRKVEFQPMMGDKSICAKEDEPERMKSLEIRRSGMSRDNGVEKVGRGCSGGRTTAVGERGKMFMGNRPKGAVRSRKCGTVSKKMERRIMESRVTKWTRETGREKGMTTKDNFGQRMEISKRASAVFGRRNRKKINLMEEVIKGEGV